MVITTHCPQISNIKTLSKAIREKSITLKAHSFIKVIQNSLPDKAPLVSVLSNDNKS
jgi:hypothetical protein